KLPIRQEIAVTGSINQRGEIQAVGAVNAKIEGFFDLCKKRGLTGSQGVIIPEQNVIDLTLNDDVIEAVEKGIFHIYAIRDINEGIEILMGRSAGILDKKGNFPKNTVHGMVFNRLKEFHEKSLESEEE
ncbi:MAG: ATP-dependent protease, partial [Defluviitaleaceae bacterium]|nr:ATP-dependent protease [Defluviitaleaceae bacterium]